MGVFNAVGRRKTAVARVYFKTEGSGKIVINDKPLEAYFVSPLMQYVVKQPLDVLQAAQSFDIKINVQGGGITGQAEAIRLGIARAIVEFDAELKSELRKRGFMTRDSREVERKKPGRPGARKRFQFSKR